MTIIKNKYFITCYCTGSSEIPVFSRGNHRSHKHCWKIMNYLECLLHYIQAWKLAGKIYLVRKHNLAKICDILTSHSSPSSGFSLNSYSRVSHPDLTSASGGGDHVRTRYGFLCIDFFNSRVIFTGGSGCTVEIKELSIRI